jgi:hypothetical protein
METVGNGVKHVAVNGVRSGLAPIVFPQLAITMFWHCAGYE